MEKLEMKKQVKMKNLTIDIYRYHIKQGAIHVRNPTFTLSTWMDDISSMNFKVHNTHTHTL